MVFRLRELPWLFQGAKERGFTLHGVGANASELPGETNSLARSGFRQPQQATEQRRRIGSQAATGADGIRRSAVEGLCSSGRHHTQLDLLASLAGQPSCMTAPAQAKGWSTLTSDVAEQLTSDDFWAFVERLATGRRLVITSDHGYAATGLLSRCGR